jgi:lipid II:glycine glycyltransferase (peptidoglycan interpeptide bridge formation enzyme)
MLIRELFPNEKDRYNAVVKHVVQSWEWGDAKEATGKKVFKYGFFENTTIHDGFELSLHPLPAPLNMWNVGYLPKSTLPTTDMLQSLQVFGQKNSCIYIKIEPNVYGPLNDPTVQEYLQTARQSILHTPDLNIISSKELFTKYNFLLDITRTDEEILANMHEKTRYNIGLAQRKGVRVVEQNDEEGFKTYLKIYFETTKRQGYYGHDEHYHRMIWETLRSQNMARILIAYYENTPITAWMLLNFHDTLYYPYGGSTTKHRNVMASNLVAWEAIQLGKRMGLHVFDMWGCMGPQPDTSDPWYGFHRFKQGYGPTHVEYIGTFDIIINPQMYKVYNTLDKYRTKWLKFRAKFR